MAGTHLSHPNLRVRMLSEEPIRGRYLVLVNLIIGGLDVDERILSLICGTEEWEHHALKDLVAAPGDLLSPVSTLPRCLSHRICPPRARKIRISLRAHADLTRFRSLPSGTGRCSGRGYSTRPGLGPGSSHGISGLSLGIIA